MLLKFTLRLFTSILGKELVYENDQFSYLVAPLLPHSQISQNADKYIDWNEVKKAEYEHLESICHDLNPLSPIPPRMAIITKEKEISKFTNFLQPGALPMLAPTTYLMPEFVKNFSIEASIFRSALLLPSILTRLDSQLLALELKNRLVLPINNEYLLSALTTSSANMEMNVLKSFATKHFIKVQKNCIYMNISITTEDSEVGSQHCTLSIHDSVVGQASSKSDTISIKLAAQIVLEKIEKDDEYLDFGCGCSIKKAAYEYFEDNLMNLDDTVIIDYADNFAHKHLNQPLINVKEISKITNFLQPGALPILAPTTYVVPKFYKKFSIGASIFRSVLLLPLILTRLDSQVPKEMGSMVKSIFVDAKLDSQFPQTLFDLWIESVLSDHVAPLMLPMINLTEAWM
ncbi:12285_t:CDS:2 [Entrophospora sp. SA101]|nr:4598_t:CDS:2 [Entrophospora sp. SA101]CAJ0636783.1 12285_t:CDS:2 [Entrophospora sp. SA101]CAJ0839142.1 8520_t:CDS:2 [Entrophospora sp. SA101]CAJ0910702.1 9401_t:CDS:2 [Entrophospora sp. SA101]